MISLKNPLMISLKNPLMRMASAQPAESFFRSLCANMAREAGIQEDLFARASYIEGLTAAKPGSISKNPRPVLQELSDALATGEENHLIEMFRSEYRMSDQDIAALVGFRDYDLFGALVQGATKVMPKGSSRGLTPQDVAMSIASGLSPLTLKPFTKYGPGRNVFYWLGEIAKGKITMGGILAILREEAAHRALDIVRGTNRGEGRSVSLDTPVGGGETDAVIGDFIADEGSMGNNIDLVYAIFNDRAVLNVVDREIRSRLGGDMQKAVWAAIASDPSMIEVSGGKVGVNNRALASSISERAGVPYSRSLEVSAGKQFREKVWPAFQEVVGDPAVVGPLLKNRDIQQIIYESTRGQPHMASARLSSLLRANAQMDIMRREAFIRDTAKKLSARVLR